MRTQQIDRELGQQCKEAFHRGGYLRQRDATNGNQLQIGTEFVPLIEKAVRRDGTIPIKLIKAGWGTSGYYSKEVLRRDGPKIFVNGTRMYWDHETAQERAMRPEGSLKNLAAVLVSDARWEEYHSSGPGLYADAKVFSPYHEAVNDMAPYIGVSINATGRARHGEAEGRKGNIVEQLISAKSADFVTAAGAGGKIASMFESYRTRFSESAANGSFVSLKENRAMNSNTPTELTREEIQSRMTEAFRDLGFSDESAARAAQGRDDDGPSNYAESMSPAFRESLNRYHDEFGPLPGATVVHHQTADDLREAARLADIREAERKVAADNEARMSEAFQDMGFSPDAARRAARGRGH